MASPGGKGIAGAERIQQPSPTLPRDSASHRRSSGPLWLQEKIFLVLYPPRSWRCTQTPLRVTWCIPPPPKLLCWEPRGWVSREHAGTRVPRCLGTHRDIPLRSLPVLFPSVIFTSPTSN